MVNWTPEQKRAIELRDHNILVSAAAGSGKTAVLVERIKQLIIKDKTGLDRFLIVTFTKAAASEMKEKLLKAITEEIKDKPENSAFLRKQLDVISTANISTFHSFALEVIRRYFYLTDVEPDFKIGDEGAVEIIKREVLDRMFEDYFEEGTEEFLDFLRCYGSDRHEKALKEMFLQFYGTVQSIPHPMEWLEKHVRQLNFDKKEFLESDIYAFVKEDIGKTIDEILDGFRKAMDFAETAGVESIYEKCRADYEILFTLKKLSEENKIDEIGSLLANFKPSQMRAKKADQESFNEIKEDLTRTRDRGKNLISDLLERYFSQSMDAYIADMQDMHPMAVYLEKMIHDFDDRFRKVKAKKNIIDFNDIEHYALQILEHEDAAAEYRDKFKYIFVDEYQDSNVMQDALINTIKREDNVFVVGDIKQSIYKFRLAEPEIFQARYRDYANEANTQSDKIDLNMNFRSKKSVIETVNGVFRELMDGYDDNAMLYQGDKYNGEIDYETELHIIDNQVSVDMELSDELAEMKNAQLEAYHTGEIIREIVGTKIYDSKQNCERSVTLKDIVILMRSTKDYAEVFQDVLRDLDIPSYVDDSSGYFDTVEIQVFLNLLSVIDNKQQDMPLLSLLYSSIFGFTVEDLIRIRLQQRKGSYYDALKNFSEKEDCQGSTDAELAGRCREFFEKLDYYRQMSQALPLEEFVWKLMWDTGYYTYCGALPAGKQRQANLRALADKAGAFKNTGYGGIYGFLTYIRSIEKREVKTGQVKLVNENEDLVRIMTIHKSKGLEFPVVIAAGMGKRFVNTKTGKGFYAHKDLGIGMTKVNFKEHWHRKTLLQMIMERKLQQEERDETTRILYVALTRAKDRLILTGTGKYLHDGELVLPKNPGSYMDQIIPLADHGMMIKKIFDRRHFDLDRLKRTGHREEVRYLMESIPQPEKDADYEDLSRRLNFHYADEPALRKKSKYSVTEYSQKGSVYEKQKDELKIPLFMQSAGKTSAARRGTVMHRVMEVIDFREALEAVTNGGEQGYMDSQIQRMLENEQILEDEKAYIEPDKIMNFFRTAVGRRAAMSDNLRKEAEFNFLKESDGVEVMVQGVIDCFFEDEDGYVLIDYKNSYINPDNREASLTRIKTFYSKQLELYSEALEIIKGKPVKESYLYLFSEGDFINFTNLH